MNYLAIDTSGKNLTIIIKKGEEIFTFFDGECGVKHSVSLMKEVENLCVKANFDLKDADFIASTVGAGSFTGIRIGVSTVKALCFALNKPCLAITSFDTLAYNVIDEKLKVLALIDAGHGGYYACGYEGNNIILPPAYLMKEDLQQISLDYDKIVGEKEGELIKHKVCLVNGFIKAIEDKKDCVSLDLDNLSPLYVRKSQAEEGRK